MSASDEVLLLGVRLTARGTSSFCASFIVSPTAQEYTRKHLFRSPGTHSSPWIALVAIRSLKKFLHCQSSNPAAELLQALLIFSIHDYPYNRSLCLRLIYACRALCDEHSFMNIQSCLPRRCPTSRLLVKICFKSSKNEALPSELP